MSINRIADRSGRFLPIRLLALAGCLWLSGPAWAQSASAQGNVSIEAGGQLDFGPAVLRGLQTAVFRSRSAPIVQLGQADGDAGGDRYSLLRIVVDPETGTGLAEQPQPDRLRDRSNRIVVILAQFN